MNNARSILSLALSSLIALSACRKDQESPGGIKDDSLPHRYANGMVSSATPEATQAGMEVLRGGGNAVDAAVAVGFALAVSLPQAGNLGGGGFMVIRMADGRSTTFDFRERAPGKATRDMYLDSAGNVIPDLSLTGALAAGVPGSPAGLLAALDKYGTKPRRQVIGPAIRLAAEGFRVQPGLAANIAEKLHDFSRFPSTLAIFAPDTIPLKAGTTFRQPALARTLQRISDSGAAGFYSGTTADMIVRQMERSGGIITHQDLLDYKPSERRPVVGTYRGDSIISMPPPSSGGPLLIQMLNMMEGYDFHTIPFHSAAHAHVMAEIMRRAYADRAHHLGDPDFFSVPVAGLVSKEYAKSRAATITDSATPSARISSGDMSAYMHESPQTTHYSVVDKDGNCVSVTVTLNASFGSKLVVDGAGFFLNDEMDDFAAKPGAPNLYGLLGDTANAIVPGKRMLSSMTPTIIIRDGRPWLVVGTPGGSTIITTVLQVIQNQADYGMTLREAGDAPRIHQQWYPDTVYYEKGAFTTATLDTLKSLGYKTVERDAPSGRVDAIRIIDVDGKRWMEGYSDSRGYGSAEGY
ncbi:MAG: gamma-glutamyltransferase [Chlorobi bacterium]|nr:gamma-glutamyltransferase [Chlorobiota bacterium]